MAFDKVVDSAVLESGLTSIANAIREKAGTSDALAFPAGFAEAIAAIQAGGNEIQYKLGTVTFSNTSTKCRDYSIKHDMGVIPTIILFHRISGSGGSSYLDFFYANPRFDYVDGSIDFYAYSYDSLYNGNKADYFTETEFKTYGSSSWTFAAQTYGWMAIAGLEEWLN